MQQTTRWRPRRSTTWRLGLVRWVLALAVLVALSPTAGHPTVMLQVQEQAVARYATIHNVHWLLRLVEETRDAIRQGTLGAVRARVAEHWD